MTSGDACPTSIYVGRGFSLAFERVIGRIHARTHAKPNDSPAGRVEAQSPTDEFRGINKGE